MAGKSESRPGSQKNKKTVEEARRGKSPHDGGKEVEILQRQTWALDLRRQGASYRKIAARLVELKLVPETYGEGLAYKDVKDAMSRLLAEQHELAEDNLRLDLMRLDELLSKVWTRAVPPADEHGVAMPADLFAVTAVLNVLDRRERLLNYKQLWKEPDKPQFNFNVDWSKFSTEEILLFKKRFLAGDEPVVILAEIEQARQADGESASGS